MILADPMLWRLMWKEYRSQRSFWLAIGATAIGLMALFMWLLDERSGRFEAPWIIALALPGLFALGSSAVSFASETEEGTTDLLRIMAARTSRLFVGKIAFTLCGTALMWGLLLAVAWIVTSGRPFSTNHDLPANDRLLTPLVVTLQCLAWGFFFSLICRKVLTAVCLTGVVSPLSGVSLFVLIAQPGSDPSLYVQLLFVPPLLALSYLLTAREMSGRSWDIRLPRPYWRRTAAIAELERLATLSETAPAWRRLFTRLVWLEFRNALTIGHVLWISTLYVLAFFPINNVNWPDPARTLFGAVFSSLLTGVWIFQAEGGKRTRFLADHGLSPQIVWLTKQVVWGLLAIAMAAPFFLGVAFVYRIRVNQAGMSIELARDIHSSVYHPGVPGAGDVMFVAALACLSYAAGQFASMLIQRAITAGFVGFVMATLLGHWTWLTVHMRIPMTLAAAPLGAILLATTFVWSRHWLLEQSTLRSRGKLAAGLLGALVVVWCAIGVYRVYEVPHPAFLDENAKLREFQGRPVSAEESATAELYRHALAQVKERNLERENPSNIWPSNGVFSSWELATPEERQWLDENREALQLFLAATERPSCAFYDPARTTWELEDFPQRQFTTPATLILFSARELESQGQLDEALNRYIALFRLARHVANRGARQLWWQGMVIDDLVSRWIPAWANHPDQTPERIEAAILRIKHEGGLPNLRDALLTLDFMIRRSLEHDWSDTLVKQHPPIEEQTRIVINIVDRLFPWERYRSWRVLDLFFASELYALDVLEEALAVGAPDMQLRAESAAALPAQRGAIPGSTLRQSRKPWKQHFVGGDFFDSSSTEGSGQESIPWNWVNSTPFLEKIVPPDNSMIWQVSLSSELSWRTMLLRLKLAAFKKAHGEYPDQDEFASFGQMAIDPYTGVEFGFRRQGYSTPVRVVNGWTYAVERVEAGRPILWSAGPGNVRRFRPIAQGDGAEKAQDGQPRYPIDSALAFVLP